MFDYNEFSINESLAPSIEDYNLVKSPRGNYYRHKDSEQELDSSWIIESDGFISVVGNVDYTDNNIKYIPFLFKKVSGNFDCSDCKLLISLKGCPDSVGGFFYCNYCSSLTSLESCPKNIGKNFSCSNCSLLTSLNGCPRIIGGNFNCGSCRSLISLEGCPHIINGNFSCSFCNYSLTSLKGCPHIINGNFSCSYCDKLSSFQGLPFIINGNFTSTESPLHTLDNFQCKIKGTINVSLHIKKAVEIIQNLFKQYPLLSEIKDYALFVHTVLGYAPELKQYYKEIPELPNSHQELSTFL